MADRRPPRRPGGGPPQRPQRPRRPGSKPRPARGQGPRLQGPRPAAEADHIEPTSEPERLQKVLAHAGVGSRRACEELILQGRVSVNGQVVRELGTRVDERARIAVDGETIHLERPVYFAVYKPKGYVSTNNDPSGRPRVVDLLPEIAQRVYSVGRLDEMSVGLMILTNDGELANKLAHPKYGVEKVYRAIVAGTPGPDVLRQLTEGVWLAEGKVRARRVRVVGHKGEATILEMVLAEGKNREVRRMLARLGHKVMSLTRVAIGPISLRGLAVGRWRHLNAHEVHLLRQAADGLAPAPSRGGRKTGRRSAPVKDAAGPRGPRRPGRPSGAGPSSPSRRPATSGPARRPGPRTARPQETPDVPKRPRPPAPSGPPRRRIIGLEIEGEGPPTGPRLHRPSPRRRPRPLPRRERSDVADEGGQDE